MEKETADVLKQIADKLDVPVQQLWAGLTAYAPFTYAQWQAQTILCVVGFVVALMVLVYSIHRLRTEELPWGPIAFVCVICVVLFGVGFTVQMGDMADALAAKEAPQAWAAKYIVRRIGR